MAHHRALLGLREDAGPAEARVSFLRFSCHLLKVENVDAVFVCYVGSTSF